MDKTVLLRAKEHFAAADPVIAALAVRFGDYRPQIASGSAFSVLSESIVSQQLSLQSAAAIWRRLQALLGGSATPAGMLAAGEEQLRECGLSRPKISYLRDLARAFSDGTVEPEAFPHLDDAAVTAQLTQVKGIGVWTAQMYLIFGLERPDVLPVADLGLRKAVQRHYNRLELPDAATLTQIGEPWRPYRSIATLYLWRSLAG